MKFRISTTAAALAALLAASAHAASDVTWTGTPLTASSTSIRTDGTLKYAYARFDSAANGVEFVGVGSGGIINNADCFVWGGTGTSGQVSPPSDTEDGGYKNLLGYHWWARAKDRKIQLKNLEVGKKYLLQIIAFRSDDQYPTYSAIAPDGETTVKYGGTDWEYGSSLCAVFTSDATTEEFTISYKGNQCVINAIQVRELPADGPAKKGIVVITY